MIWKILGIEKTKDKESIRRAYHDKLHSVNPEDDQEGFKKLRRAYEEAMEYADREENDNPEKNSNNEVTENDGGKKKTEVDLWIDRIDRIYTDAATRRDVNIWRDILNDPLCEDLDTEIEASEKLLVYIMSHSFMPQSVWKVIDDRFHYLDNIEQLKEHFPEDFLSYVRWQTVNPGFVDFELFDGNTSCEVDKYISRLHELKNAEEERNFKRIDEITDELEMSELKHPYLFVEKAITKMLKAGELPELLLQNDEGEKGLSEEEKTKLKKEALEIMEDVDFEYSGNSYIHRVYGEVLLANRMVDNAKEVFDSLLDQDPQSYSALLCRAKCLIVLAEYESAKEQLEDILEERVQDVETLRLLDVVNETLVKSYTEKLQNDKEYSDKETVIKLGWCYYQRREFKQGIELLDKLGDSDDYDYVNLRCRLYLANDEYEKAYPWAEKWLEMIKNSEEDGSKEMKKRKNRLSLAYFSLGVCIWESSYIKGTIEDDEERAVSFIQKAIEQESNRLVMLSYMEQLARFYLSTKEYEKCVDICTEIIEKDSGFFPAYVHRQKANYELRQAREVIDDYYICTDIYSAYAPPYILAAEVFYAFEQFDDVEEVINKAKESGIDSDALKLIKIKMIHYRDFSKENLEKAYNMIKELKNNLAEIPESEPSDIEKTDDLYREYAVILWDMDRNEDALNVIDEYMEANPDSTSLAVLKTDILFQSGRGKEGLEISREVFKKNPTVYNQTRLGLCYERLDDYDNAIRNYNEAYEKDPGDAGVLRRLMYLYSYLSDKKGDLDLCRLGIRYATEYIDVTNAAEGYVERGNLYIDIYELEKSVYDCKKAIELNPEAYYAYNNLGCALLKLRRIDEAIKPLEQAVELDKTKDHLPYLNLAECYTVLGDYQKSIDILNEMLELFPKRDFVKKDIAKLHCRLKEYHKAVSYYKNQIDEKQKELQKGNIFDVIRGNKESLPVEEKIMQLYSDMADIYRQAGDIKQMEECYKKVLKRWRSTMKPAVSVKAVIAIAEYYRDSGQLDKARRLIKEAFGKMTEKDRNSSVWKDLAFVSTTIYYELKDILNAKNEARIYFEQYKKRNGEFETALLDARYRPANLYCIGIAYLCMGELDKAKEYLHKINDCELCVMCEYNGCFEYWFGMGLVAEEEGRKEEAVACFEKAIMIKGDYPCAKRHLSLCKE